MGYCWNTRSPEEVQRRNGQAYDFDKIAKRYEEIEPLRGKRKAQNIRPNGERGRCHERVVKVSDNEYYLTNMAYRWGEKHGYTPHRAITFKRNDDGTEVIIVHTPRQYWGDTSQHANLIPRQIGVPSTFYFYSYNLPSGLSMCKYYSKNYIAVQNDGGDSDGRINFSYYTLDKGDVHLTRQVGDKFFKPLIVHREIKRSLDRAKTKEIRKELAPFFEYVRVMTPLAESNRQSCYQSPTFYSQQSADAYKWNTEGLSGRCLGKGWRGLFTGEDNELWFDLVRYYKSQHRQQQWNPQTREYDELGCDPKAITRAVANQVYYIEKPLHEEPVELGERTFDKYRSW